jgi:hypothetical protein
MNPVMGAVDAVIGQTKGQVASVVYKTGQLEDTVNNLQSELTALAVDDVADGNTYSHFTGGTDLKGSLDGIDAVLGTLTAAVGGGFLTEDKYTKDQYELTSSTGFVAKTHAPGDFTIVGTTGLTADVGAGKAYAEGESAEFASISQALVASRDNYLYADAKTGTPVLKDTVIGAGEPSKLDSEVALYKFETDATSVVSTTDLRNFAAIDENNIQDGSITTQKIASDAVTSDKIATLNSILEYGSDLSGLYTNRTLVDKEYVDGLVSGVTAGIWVPAGGSDYYYDAGNIGIGTNSPTDTLHIDGTFKYVSGTEAAGRVLVSDAGGVATWADQVSLVSAQDEGILLAANISAFNFKGAGVQATDAGGGIIDVEITGIAAQLNDLTDVTAPTPLDGDMFHYDAGAGEWVNTSLISVSPTAISISNGLDITSSGGTVFSFGSTTIPHAMEMNNVGEVTITEKLTYTYDNAGASPLGAGKVLTSDGAGGATWEDSVLTSTLWSQNGNSIQANDLTTTDAIIPHASGIVDLGSNIFRWKDIYVGSTVNFASDIVFSEAGTERARILAGGNFGVGVPSPAESLHLSGAMILGTTVGTTNGTLRWTGTDFEGRKGGNWVSFTSVSGDGIYDGSGTTPAATAITATDYVEFIGRMVFPKEHNSYISFDDADTTYIYKTGSQFLIQANDTNDIITISNPTGNITLAANGNVGVGTASPTQKLHVVGNTLIDGDFQVSTTLSANGFYVQDSNGYVGTNNANPQTHLHVHNPAATDVFLKITNTTTAASLTDGLDIGFKQGVSFLMKGHDLADMNWEFGTTGRMTLKHDTGNLGIGTAAPSEKLHVIGGLRTDGQDGIGFNNASPNLQYILTTAHASHTGIYNFKRRNIN